MERPFIKIIDLSKNGDDRVTVRPMSDDELLRHNDKCVAAAAFESEPKMKTLEERVAALEQAIMNK